MSSLLFRQTRCIALRHISIRPFSQSVQRPFISNFFGSKQLKQREDIIKNQDNYETDQDSKIVILNEQNSPEYKPFSPSEDMPDFQVSQWKNHIVRSKDIENTYSPESLQTVINKTYEEVNGTALNGDYSSISLNDLEFRFKFSKHLQQNLGFDINDYVLTRSHTLEALYNELCDVISTRWTDERNPNAIVLRREDFTSPNVYLNEEFSKEEQERVYNELLEKAKETSLS
mmetsp:Transcript_2638/g.3095  ORF Transcript_2638/g.3095 Transcript_2638/m.3095 type:complete len:230 (-) Transcript_2638:38-727(-)